MIITDRDFLKSKVSELKTKGNKIVFTNGCFDIIHHGHIKYLQSAKRLGDILIIGVNTDESIRRIKGETRPIIDLEYRMSVLDELSSVDIVVPFYEDTPLELIKIILPDFLVKGGDWKIKDIVGSDIVIKNGGTVKSLDFIKGISTTEIIEKIKKRYCHEF
jgi:rfaE bifunctional protein nucleotidyltransferase chain/domain